MSVFVYSGAQMKQADCYAIEVCGIDSKQLMDTAACGIVRETERRVPLAEKTCVLVCGKGNNGGDGFAAALHFCVHCAEVKTVCLWEEESLSEDARYYRGKTVAAGVECITDLQTALKAIADADLVVDALYGFGFRGELSDMDAELCRAMNASRAYVVSADIPSGVGANDANVAQDSVCADLTVTFTGYKLSAILFDSALYYGEIAVADIGLPAEAKNGVKPIAHVVDANTALDSLGIRRRNMHKGDFSKVFVLGGSRGMSGAVYMSAQAALKSGAGLVVAGVPDCISDIMEIKTTEVMTLALNEENGGLRYDAAAICQAQAYDALAFGMGAGRASGIREFLRKIIAEVQKPILIDADGLYALSEDMDMLKGHTQTIALTPHSGEMARLCKKTTEEIEADRIGAAKMLAQAYNVYVVLKGAHTVIASPNGEVAISCLVGNSGMATAGSGDVLSGIGALMLARNTDAFSAMQAAVYIHAFAGDLAAQEKGEDGMCAGDMLEALPYAIQKIRENENQFGRRCIQ